MRRIKMCLLLKNSRYHSTAVRSLPNGLIKHLESDIRFGGPISVARYMRQALTHPVFGYYAHRDEVFGKNGDYITSPEISHLMGELAGLWYILAWEAMGAPKSVQFVELGPGRATMLCDMLRAFNCFNSFRNALSTIFLVEISPRLREVQLQEITMAFKNSSYEQHFVERDENGWVSRLSSKDLSVIWVENISDIESPHPTYILAHEFFDALPLHKFKLTKFGWREILVGIKEENENGCGRFKYVLAPSATPSLALIEASGALVHKKEHLLGDVVEVSPDSALYAQSIAKILHENKGAALIFDYGENFPSNASLRAIRNHRFVDLFEDPGTCDLSANVDFSALKRFVLLKNYESVSCHGPITQSAFLASMGIRERVTDLLSKIKNDLDKISALKSGVERLMLPEKMGTLYKCITISSGSLLKDPPICF